MYREKIYTQLRLNPKSEWSLKSIQELKLKYGFKFYFFNNLDKVYFKYEINNNNNNNSIYYIAEKLNTGYQVTRLTKINKNK